MFSVVPLESEYGGLLGSKMSSVVHRKSAFNTWHDKEIFSPTL